jgi:hypothetical protein
LALAFAGLLDLSFTTFLDAALLLAFAFFDFLIAIIASSRLSAFASLARRRAPLPL